MQGSVTLNANWDAMEAEFLASQGGTEMANLVDGSNHKHLVLIMERGVQGSNIRLKMCVLFDHAHSSDH